MPRPERPIDPSAGPVQDFAASLRKLRAEAGNPTYREMARTVPASKASLSAAAAGHRLPTWEVAREYVRACDGDLAEWHGRWQATTAEIGRPAPASEPPPPPRRRPVILVATTIMAAAVAALVVFLVAVHNDPPGRTAVAASAPVSAPVGSIDTAQPVADNADPKKSGCASGANAAAVTSLDRVEVNTAAHNLLGELVLRHAPACHASWGRFEPSGRLLYLREPTTVTITAHRPATGTTGTPYSTAFDGQEVFGAILLDTQGCVEVTVLIESAAGGGSATTRCRR